MRKHRVTRCDSRTHRGTNIVFSLELRLKTRAVSRHKAAVNKLEALEVISLRILKPAV